MKSLPQILFQPKIKTQSFLCLVICLAIANSLQQCFTQNSTQSSGPLKLSLTNSLKDFESGSYTITNTNTTLQRYHCFNLTLMYINPKSEYQVVGSITNIDGYQDSLGIDFSVRFSPNQSIIQCLFIMSNKATWIMAKIQYIISARQDFRVGTFIPEQVDFLPCGNTNQKTTINYRLLRNWNASTSLVFGLTFLSGIRTMDTSLNITLGRSSFDTSSSILSIPVDFSQVNYPIQYIVVSYLIVTMNSDFQITNIYDLDYIPSDIHVFVGMTGVQLAPQESGVLKSTANISNILSKTNFEVFFGVQGLVIQSSSNLDILFSDGNYSSQGKVLECVSPQKCAGYDGYMVYTQSQDGMVFHSKCILCGKFSSYNNVTQKCQCRELYIKVNDSCVSKSALCDATKYLVFNESTLRCQCMDEYVLSGNVCVTESPCPVGFTLFMGNCYKIITTLQSSQASTSSTEEVRESRSYTTNDTTTGKTNGIVTIITQTTTNPNLNETNSTMNLSSIQQQQPQYCKPPAIYNDTMKVCTCQLPQYYNQSSEMCLNCGPNEVYNIKTKICVCMEGAFRMNEVCDVCSVNGFFNGNGCQCLPGYLGNGKICRENSNFVIPITNTPLTQTPANNSSTSVNNQPTLINKSSSQSGNSTAQSTIIPTQPSQQEVTTPIVPIVIGTIDLTGIN